jgi:hypothetical protein
MLKYIFAKIRQNHLLTMVLCCAIPIVGILALSYLGVLGSWGYLALILICPLGHLFMMRGMHSANKDAKVQTVTKEIERT